MFLRHYCLSETELKKLDEVMQLINGVAKGTIIQTVFQAELSAFLAANNLSDEAFGRNPKRFLTATSIASRDYAAVVLIYDFLTTHLVRSHYLKAILDKGLPDIVMELRGLIFELKKMRSREFEEVSNPMVNLLGKMDLDIQTGTANDSVFQEYVGYRRSSNRGDIIRFYVKIMNAPLNRMISFENRYKRHDDNWHVEGFGYVVQDVYYLIGHCQNDAEVSRGVRVMALRRDVGKNYLYGVLTSMDRRDPICCRILLLPYDDHHFPEKKEMTREDHIERILYRNGSDDYREFTEEVDKSLIPFTKEDPDFMYRHICNANFSVIRADPARDQDLIDIEVNFRKAFFEKYDGNMEKARASYIQLMRDALAKEMD